MSRGGEWKIMKLGQLIAYNLKALRKKRDLTLGQLAELGGISKARFPMLKKVTVIWQSIRFGK